MNGTLIGEKTTFPNVLKFSCDEGFTQHGASKRTCKPNGRWSGNETSCQGVVDLLMVARNSFQQLCFDGS